MHSFFIFIKIDFDFFIKLTYFQKKIEIVKFLYLFDFSFISLTVFVVNFFIILKIILFTKFYFFFNSLYFFICEKTHLYGNTLFNVYQCRRKGFTFDKR